MLNRWLYKRIPDVLRMSTRLGLLLFTCRLRKATNSDPGSTITLLSHFQILLIVNLMKEFTVPPVIFPSGDSSIAGNGNGNGLYHRRVPTAPFQPSRPSSPPIPFVSFDVGPTFSAPAYGGPSSASIFPGEPSLLEELEIDAALIHRKTVSLLNPFRINSALHDPADLSGPFLYYMCFCLFQMLAGKVQFGVVLGYIVVFSAFLYVVLNMLEGKNGNLDLYRCLSLVGYSMLPVVVFSAVSLFVPANFGLAAIFVLWSTRICSRLLTEGTYHGCEHHGLIAYPCFLIYSLFSMLVIF
ncbi:hypothetical protein NMG60_11001439 [Bertholletia excelsa]